MTSGEVRIVELVQKPTVLDSLRHLVPTDPADLGFVGEAPVLIFASSRSSRIARCPAFILRFWLRVMWERPRRRVAVRGSLVADARRCAGLARVRLRSVPSQGGPGHSVSGCVHFFLPRARPAWLRKPAWLAGGVPNPPGAWFSMRYARRIMPSFAASVNRKILIRLDF